jgi:hypothetical protein
MSTHHDVQSFVEADLADNLPPWMEWEPHELDSYRDGFLARLTRRFSDLDPEETELGMDEALTLAGFPWWLMEE